MSALGWLCALAAFGFIFALIGHAMWLAGAAVLTAVFGSPAAPPARPVRSFRYCPACRAETSDRDDECPTCGLSLDGRLAHDLHRVRVAEREVRTLVEHAQIDADTAGRVLDELEARARVLQGLPAKKAPLPRAKPVEPAPAALAPSDAVEVITAEPKTAAAPPEAVAVPVAALSAAPP